MEVQAPAEAQARVSKTMQGVRKEQRHPMGELPKPVCDMLDVIEHFTGTQVISIGNVRSHLSRSVYSFPISALALAVWFAQGPRGDEIVYIRRTRDDA